MDTARYKQLLADLNGYVGISDAQSSRVTARWLRSLNDITGSSLDRVALLDHLTRVSRSLSAITIISKERASQAKLARAPEVIESSSVELAGEIRRLQSELRRIDEVLEDRGLQSIIGEFLSSVEFVMDYMQLHFNGATLTTFTCPQVSDGELTLSQADPGYRDALCGIIGAKVIDAQVVGQDTLKVSFSDSRAITVSLKPENAIGPEYAYFTSSTGFCCSWG